MSLSVLSLGRALIVGATLAASSPFNVARANEIPFFGFDDDVPPPDVVEREARLYRKYLSCDYLRALEKYGRDIDARRACHGMLFP